MNGTQKQIEWALDVQATAIENLRGHCVATGQAGTPEAEAAITLLQEFDNASEWVNRLRNRNPLDVILNDWDDTVRNFRLARKPVVKLARNLV